MTVPGLVRQAGRPTPWSWPPPAELTACPVGSSLRPILTLHALLASQYLGLMYPKGLALGHLARQSLLPPKTPWLLRFCCHCARLATDSLELMLVMVLLSQLPHHLQKLTWSRSRLKPWSPLHRLNRYCSKLADKPDCNWLLSCKHCCILPGSITALG